MLRALSYRRYFPVVSKELEWVLPFAEEAREVLREKPKYMSLLQSLDYRMGQEVNRQLKTVIKASEYREMLRIRGELLIPKKILHNTLHPIETQHGFNEVAYLMGIVSPEQFNQEILAKGRLIKDPSIGEGHGEASHRLQINTLILACGEGMLQLPDGLRVVDFIKALAHFNRLEDDGFHGRFADRGLWDGVFDRNAYMKDDANSPFNTESVLDISSPENLTAMVNSHEVILPYLAATLQAREDKRKAQGLRDPREWVKYEAGANYYALKMFRKTLKECTSEERSEAYRSQGGLVFLSNNTL